MYTIICDNCKIDAGRDSGYSCWNEKSYAKEDAIDADWIEEGDKHYCTDCYNYDDDDNLIIDESRKNKYERNSTL